MRSTGYRSGCRTGEGRAIPPESLEATPSARRRLARTEAGTRRASRRFARRRRGKGPRPTPGNLQPAYAARQTGPPSAISRVCRGPQSIDEREDQRRVGWRVTDADQVGHQVNDEAPGDEVERKKPECYPPEDWA